MKTRQDYIDEMVRLKTERQEIISKLPRCYLTIEILDNKIGELEKLLCGMDKFYG
jgi:hypothetical protein